MGINLKNRVKGDPVIWTAIIILCVYSLLAIYSGLSNMPLKPGQSRDLFAEKELLYQFILIALGLFIMWSVHLIKWRVFLRKTAPIILIISWVLIIIPIVLGKDINQSNRILPIGSITIQIFDIAKIALIIYLSSIMLKGKDLKNSFKDMFLWVYLPIFITVILILRSNLSTALICFAVSFALMFFRPISIKSLFHFIGLSFAFCLLLIIVGKAVPEAFPRASTWANRIVTFTHKNDVGAEDKDKIYQEEQAKIAIGTGGVFGKGPGSGTQRHVLPQSYDDYIFTIIVEEYGILFGAIPLVVIYLILVYRGFRISLKSDRKFSSYLVFGITFLYVFQAFMHIAVSVDLTPVTGQPLPFVSKGGTALWIACAAFGLVLSESRLNEQERLKALEEENEAEIEDEVESDETNKYC
ncbi:MAG: FtsW/RodA/SpoVE family cell cycle protein [Bacteroidales bacterium]|jgi:cell division protein FtsW|nr:FtsW/RodA/SpoVE family cell cycle protein [Bacteroidales bacterium]